MVEVFRLEARAHRGRNAARRRERHRRVEARLERPQEPILGGQRQSGEHVGQPDRGADDRLVGEAALAVVHAQPAGRRERRGGREGRAEVVRLRPDVAGAEADIRHEPAADGRDAEVVERVAHHAVLTDGPAGAEALHAAVDARDAVVAVAALDLGAEAVAEAPADAADADPALAGPDRPGGLGGDRDALDRKRRDVALHTPVHAGAARDIQAGHGLRLGNQRQRHQGRRSQGSLLEAHPLSPHSHCSVAAPDTPGAPELAAWKHPITANGAMHHAIKHFQHSVARAPQKLVKLTPRGTDEPRRARAGPPTAAGGWRGRACGPRAPPPFRTSARQPPDRPPGATTSPRPRGRRG